LVLSLIRIGDLDLDQYRWIVCVGHDEADRVRSALGTRPASVVVANEHQGGIPDPYELGPAGYRDCVALLDQVMPHIARHISGADVATRSNPHIFKEAIRRC
jgi:protein-tyrosine-phosphatase